MYITWLGHSCFKLISKQADKEVTIITDPYSEGVGFKPSRLFADIVTVSHDHDDHNNFSAVHGTSPDADPFVITLPGEYEIKKVLISGFDSYHDNKEGADRGHNLIYRFDLEGISIAHLGDLGQKALTEKQMNELLNIDIIIIPIGGKYTLGAKDAVNLISQLEPRIVIPMHYKIKGLKVDVNGPEEFAKEMGISKIEPVSKLRVTKKELQSGDREVIFLEKI